MTKTSNKIIRFLDAILNAAIALIALLILFVSIYSLLDNAWQIQGARDRSLLIYKPQIDLPMSAERRISENQVGWITLYETDIDYPVMQGVDNNEYLNKDPYGEFKLSGSIFLDYRNDPAFNDSYSMIYGHHMADGAMFGSLDLYRDENYFESHRNGRLITCDAVYEFELFAVCSALGTDSFYFNPTRQTASDMIENLRSTATFFREPDPMTTDRVVALSTCSGETALSRFIVLGTIHERDEH